MAAGDMWYLTDYILQNASCHKQVVSWQYHLHKTYELRHIFRFNWHGNF